MENQKIKALEQFFKELKNILQDDDTKVHIIRSVSPKLAKNNIGCLGIFWDSETDYVRGKTYMGFLDSVNEGAESPFHMRTRPDATVKFEFKHFTPVKKEDVKFYEE